MPCKVIQKLSLSMMTLLVPPHSKFLILTKLVPHSQRLTSLGFLTRVNTALDTILRGVTHHGRRIVMARYRGHPRTQELLIPAYHRCLIEPNFEEKIFKL
ncbi:hypothetical protein HanPSC8_Chr09g0354201 [Helianthus annuus]|nr:hypothetical protein HanPSC8_Chr09g0354201 [Helianthus annuus]